MLRRLSVRGKVLAVLAVPILVLVLAATFISAQALNEVRVARAVNGALGSLQTVRVFAQSVQAERAAAINHVAEVQLEAAIDRGDVKETPEQKAERSARAEERAAAYASAKGSTDATMGRASARMDEVDFDALDPLVLEATQRAFTVAQGIQGARDAVDRGNVAPNVIDNQYSAVIREALQLTERFSDTIDNRQLGVYLSAYALVDLTTERIANERDFGHYAIERDGTDDSANSHLRGLFPETNSVHARARTAVDALARADLTMPDLGVSFDGFANWQSQRINITARDQGFESVRENAWFDMATQEGEALSPTLSDLWRVAQAEAQAAQSNALSQATLTIILAVLALALSVLLALLIARTIVVPLQRLTAAAGEVRDQLPRLVEQVATPGEGPDLSLVQIPVVASDEVGRLAAAFNEVNQKTVEVAQEQAALRGSIAEMFVNVARRDQVLLNRQLSFIDTLEREEEDPNTLANLFRLDHLATRMRRNAESLLVLAGIDSGRRVRGSMTLSDVIRTASSEIEQYDRVGLELNVDPHMHGFNSLPAAHLLAELLENATVFSEPGTPVEVVTSAEIEFITVTVIDRGLGMSEEDIAAANQRIRQVSASEVVGAQRLGLHVVGRLANRLGTKVVFAKADDEGGTQVRVRFPRALFVDDAQEAQPGSGGRLLNPEEIAREQAPEAVPVDLEALTDGETGLGLPRRRSSDAAEPAPAGPAAPGTPLAPAASAPSTSSGLPARRNFVLPETVAPNLAPEVAASAAAGWSPAVAAPTVGGLPSRAVGATAAAKPTDDGPVAPPRPAAATLDPSARSGMFAGFRRGAESLEAVDATASAEPAEVQPDEAQAAPASEPMVIPGLAPDDDAPASFTPTPPAAAPELPVRGETPSTVEAPTASSAAEPEAPAAWSPSAPEAPAAPAAWSAAEPEAPAPVVGEAPEAPAAPAWSAAESEAPAAWSPSAPEAPAAPAWSAAESEAPAAWSPSAPEAPAAPAAWSAAEPEAPAPVVGEAPVTQAPAPWSPSAPEAPAAWSAAEPEAPAAWSPSAPEAPAAPAAWSAPEPEAPEPVAWETPVTQAPAPWSPSAPEAPAAPSWGPADAAWSPAQPEPVAEQHYPTPSPVVDPEPYTPEPAASQYPAFSPDAGYADPVAPAWSSSGVPSLEPDDPVWSPTSAPSAEPAPEAPQAAQAIQSWPHEATVAQPEHTPAPEPLPSPAPATSLPAFSDVVGVPAEAPSRRSRRSDSSKPSRAERRAARKAEAKARAEEKALAKAEARARKKGKGGSAPSATSAEPAAPAPGFLAQPTSIAALRAQSASVPSASAPEASTPAMAPSEPAAAAPAPVRQPTAWSAPPVQAPTPAPAAPAAPVAPAVPAAPAAHEGFTPAFQPRTPAAPTAASPSPGASFSPAPAAAWSPGGAMSDGSPRQFGVLDDEVAAMLALRSDIQEQALSELSQLSAYRPQVVKPAASLTKRTPSAVPTAPEMAEPEGGQPRERDAEELRSRLSSFQSGTSRGRRAPAPSTDSAPSTGGAVPMANGSAEHAAPGASSSESTQEAQTW